MTINELLVLIKAIRERLSGLKTLRSQVASKTTWYGDTQKSEEPQYDVKAVDRKITGLETWLFKADAAIKQSNAKTEITIDAKVDELLAPLT